MKVDNNYSLIIEHVFHSRFQDGVSEVPFKRSDLQESASVLGLPLPKNLGDVIYSLRYRTALPVSITRTQPEGYEWTIVGAGRAEYKFKLARVNRIRPNPHLILSKLPDATPQIVRAYSLSDEQALLCQLRYNRLLDIFLGMATYSLQSHLRTYVKNVGQIEIDELYVGVNSRGAQFVIPVQAKGGTDELSVVQTFQDLECCSVKFPDLICRPISAQFLENGTIALFELCKVDDEIRVVQEKHFELVQADQITPELLKFYAQ